MPLVGKNKGGLVLPCFLSGVGESCRFRPWRAGVSWNISTIQDAAVDVKHTLLEIKKLPLN